MKTLDLRPNALGRRLHMTPTPVINNYCLRIREARRNLRVIVLLYKTCGMSHAA